MLRTSPSPNSQKTKRRQLLSLNRPHNITSKPSDEKPTTIQSSSSQSPISVTTLPPTTFNHDTVESPKTRPESNESSSTTLGEYHCPICNKNLSTFNTSYSRQQHIDGCLSSADDGTTEENRNIGDEQSLESLFMDYCSFCGKPISHLKGVHKERHFDQCLTALETEQQLAEQQQQLTTYAGHSIPFLQDSNVCPVCHDSLPGSSLRNKISHIKRCAKQRSLTMEQLLRKIQWMQWGHLPIQNTSSADTSLSSSSSSSFYTTSPPLNYSMHATELPSTNNNNITTTRSTPSLITKKRAKPTDYTNSEGNQEADDDFRTDVLVYKVASWQQTRFKKAKLEPTEDESIAMALSLSLMDEEEQLLSRRTLARRKKRNVNLNASSIVSIEESRALAKLALQNMLEKRTHYVDDDGRGGDSSMVRFPLATSHVQPTLPRRQDSLPSGSSISCTSLWSQASCLYLD